MVEIIEAPAPAPPPPPNKKKRQPKQTDGPKRTRTRTRKNAAPLLSTASAPNSKINIKLNVKRDPNDAATGAGTGSGKITTARQRMSAANRVKEVLGKTSGLTGGGGGGQGTGLDKLRNVSRLISTNQVHNLAEIDPHDLLDTINHVLNIAHEATVTFSSQRESISGTMRRMLLELYNTRYDMTLVHAREHAGISVHVAVAHNTFQSPTTFRPAFSALVADNPFQGRQVDNVHYQRRKKPAAAPLATDAASLSTSIRIPIVPVSTPVPLSV